MKLKLSGLALAFMLLFSFSVGAIGFNAEELYGSVVVVSTGTGVGSGFSVREDLILTNAHVVGGARKVNVTMYDGENTIGDVVKMDRLKDLALIHIDKSLTPLVFSEQKPTVGQEVYAIGTPRDMPYTMTKGIISALDRQIGMNSYIQVDASVNSGNSGGPLVDEAGSVIGVITLKADDAEGIGFAINISDVQEFITEADYMNADDEPDTSAEAPEADRRLVLENGMLKILVCLLTAGFIVMLLLYLHALSRIRRDKPKDEFDFEIEIEE